MEKMSKKMYIVYLRAKGFISVTPIYRRGETTRDLRIIIAGLHNPLYIGEEIRKRNILKSGGNEGLGRPPHLNPSSRIHSLEKLKEPK